MTKPAIHTNISMPSSIRLRVLVALLLALGFAGSLPAAELSLAPWFADHMVLQRDRKICIWGMGNPNASVEVKIATQQAEAIIGADGHWKAYLNPVCAGGPYNLQVLSAGRTNSITDVFYGDVWLCSGQSNMQMPVKECVADEQVDPPAVHPHLRLCTVAKGWNAHPQYSADIKWKLSDPDSAQNFSAVGYFFASELLRGAALKNVPIGIVDSSFGGTFCEGWIPQSSLSAFNTNDLHNSMFGIQPSMLYNAMISPLGEAAFKGVIWYQGEANSGHPDTYPRLLSTMIGDWRQQFGISDLPFFIVQLPDYVSQWDGFFWSWQREAQAITAQTTPNTYLVVGIETTDGFDLHPKQKLEIGRRTALMARHTVYKEKVIGQGPVFKNAQVETSTIRVTFDTDGDGLASRATNGIRGFALAGADGVYHFSNARIDGDSVVLQCDQVPSPKTVRYAWAGVPDSTLINKSGLPAAPFRTDNFPPSNIEVQKSAVSRHINTSAYDITVDGDGRVTSLVVNGVQFISNEAGMSGATSIPVMFGNRSLANIQNPGPQILSCSDQDITFLLEFKSQAMDWTLSNRGKDEISFNIALSSQAVVSGKGGSEPIVITRKKSTLAITGIDSVSDSENGSMLHVSVKGGASRKLSFDLTGK